MTLAREVWATWDLLGLEKLLSFSSLISDNCKKEPVSALAYAFSGSFFSVIGSLSHLYIGISYFKSVGPESSFFSFALDGYILFIFKQCIELSFSEPDLIYWLI